jgi:hypothetical protein
VTLNRARDAGVSVCNAVYFKAINPRTGKKEAAFSWTLGARWRPKGMDPLLHAWCAELAHEALAGARVLPLPGDVRFAARGSTPTFRRQSTRRLALTGSLARVP